MLPVVLPDCCQTGPASSPAGGLIRAWLTVASKRSHPGNTTKQEVRRQAFLPRPEIAACKLLRSVLLVQDDGLNSWQKLVLTVHWDNLVLPPRERLRSRSVSAMDSAAGLIADASRNALEAHWKGGNFFGWVGSRGGRDAFLNALSGRLRRVRTAEVGEGPIPRRSGPSHPFWLRIIVRLWDLSTKTGRATKGRKYIGFLYRFGRPTYRAEGRSFPSGVRPTYRSSATNLPWITRGE